MKDLKASSMLSGTDLLEALAVRAERVATDRMLERLKAEIAPLVEDAVARALDRRNEDSLQPLHRIIGGTAAAARMRIERDPELRKLGTICSAYTFTKGKHAGRTAQAFKFRPSEVTAYLRARGGR